MQINIYFKSIGVKMLVQMKYIVAIKIRMLAWAMILVLMATGECYVKNVIDLRDGPNMENFNVLSVLTNKH